MILRRMVTIIMLLAAGFVASGMGSRPQAVESLRITTEELKTRLGAPDLVILDVRAGKDWQGSGRKIAGAIREDPHAFESWAGKYPKDKTIVLYCA